MMNLCEEWMKVINMDIVELWWDSCYYSNEPKKKKKVVEMNRLGYNNENSPIIISCIWVGFYEKIMLIEQQKSNMSSNAIIT
jgi:hypothetical protein